MVNREKMTRNFVERYGLERLDRLLDALSAGESGETIAREFDVSRERVRQWKIAFGQVVMIYQVHPDVLRVAAAARTAR